MTSPGAWDMGDRNGGQPHRHEPADPVWVYLCFIFDVKTKSSFCLMTNSATEQRRVDLPEAADVLWKEYPRMTSMQVSQRQHPWLRAGSTVAPV